MSYLINIDKNTDLYGSFALKAGSKGCNFFNTWFDKLGINAIYKSFSVKDIEQAVQAALTLDMKGFAITMPFKSDVLKHVDKLTRDVEKIGAANTIVNKDGVLTAHNTDFLAAQDLLKDFGYLFRAGKHTPFYILGNGGYSKAVQYAAKRLNLIFAVITREEWPELRDIRDSLIFNCTPTVNIIDASNTYIDCRTSSRTGLALSQKQASYQFKIYTGHELP
tara:strand:+ start:542 stop:1204 length:663 start_codon:yes stop_codon:yes gene_type:complete